MLRFFIYTLATTSGSLQLCFKIIHNILIMPEFIQPCFKRVSNISRHIQGNTARSHASVVVVWIKPAGTVEALCLMRLSRRSHVVQTLDHPGSSFHNQRESFWLHEWTRLVRPPLKRVHITSQWGCSSIAVVEFFGISFSMQMTHRYTLHHLLHVGNRFLKRVMLQITSA